MKVDLVKIVEDVWNEEDLHSGFSKIAALTCLQRLEEQTNLRVIEELERQMEFAEVGNSYTRLRERIKELKQE
tara:strand:+ start:271 stop:489 length:219 start_codon:yes stop_codon:yes gene_type:complete